MELSYNKLWKMLIDKNMSKSELVRLSKISTNAMARMGRNEGVRLGTLVKICHVLDCKIDDIVEVQGKIDDIADAQDRFPEHRQSGKIE